MDVNYCVIHVAKFKSWSLIAMEKHLNRTAQTEGSHTNYDINPELTKFNVNLMDRDEKYNQFKIREKYKEVTKNLDSKPRKDAVMFISVVVSASPKFFKDMTMDQIENYFEAAKDFLMDFYGPENCIGAYVNVDEEGNKNREANPHMHFLVAPIKDNKLCCKKVVTRNSLRKLQDDLPKYLQARGYDVERGVFNSPRRHTDKKTWERAERIKDLTQQELLKRLNIKRKPQKNILGKLTGNEIVDSNELQEIIELAEMSVSLIENNEEYKRRVNEFNILFDRLNKEEKELIEKMKKAQAKAEELESYEKTLREQDKNILYQNMIDDVRKEKELLEKQMILFVQGVSEDYQNALDEEMRKYGEQGKVSVKSMKILKQNYPTIWEEVVDLATKDIKKNVNRKVQKAIQRETENLFGKK